MLDKVCDKSDHTSLHFLLVLLLNVVSEDLHSSLDESANDFAYSKVIVVPHAS